MQWQDPDGSSSVYCCPGNDRIRMAVALFTADLASRWQDPDCSISVYCWPSDDRIRMVGSLFTADLAVTGSWWQDICFLLSWRWQDLDGRLSIFCCPSDDRIRMAASLFAAVLANVPRIRGQDNFAKFIPREGERELAGKQLWQVYK